MNSQKMLSQEHHTKTSPVNSHICERDLERQTQTSDEAPVKTANVPERKWAIDCTDPKLRNRLRERFESLAVYAVEVELRTHYKHRSQAVDAWLDLLKQETQFAHDWKIDLLLTASAERCRDLRLRALTNEQPSTANIWDEIEHQLRALIAENPRDELYAILDIAGTPSTAESLGLEGSTSGAAEPNRRTDRQARVETYIKEVFYRTGKRITKADIWRSAGDKCRTEFERWESYYYENRSRKVNASAQRRFMRILTEKPHLKIFPAFPRIFRPCAPPCREPDTAPGTAKQLSQEKSNANTKQRPSA